MPDPTQVHARIALSFLLAVTFSGLAAADVLIPGYSVRLFVYLIPLIGMLVLMGEQIDAPWFSTGGDDE